MDYVDRAKDELLRVNSSDRATLPKIDALYLDAITATARLDSAKSIELYKQIANEASGQRKSLRVVDLGRAYENNNDLKDAIESYKEASKRNSQYRDCSSASGNSLRPARRPHHGPGNRFNRLNPSTRHWEIWKDGPKYSFNAGRSYNKRNKLPEARKDLEQALNLAKANDNKSQTIKTLLQL